ncbi:DUF4166 domain-containing protein [Sutcliffiella rhizosphaerae]|uniref:DUF4166 domain-containing protein n=1 Tax=Sutcliffiella rhizosphaerae TaxID=2880967 RepID=A0ABM8YQJ6_9BACI|nr:DUF4166 domain-containing protein [Sutcliffiella rhizosphaerae]CAG9622289.1 hypothetical protein BACCIP111883_03080 [Sutcliffiella rhizosphaerae]
MLSIYEQALGENYKQLHPQLQKKFGLTSEMKIASICHGVMEEIWGGRFYMYPFLQLGTLKNITFPERGKDIPFTLENYAYQNSFGQECMAWIRRFHFNKTRSFDATMIYKSNRRRIVDYLGIDQDLITDIDISVLDNGGIRLLSAPLVLYKHGLKVSIPRFFSGTAEALEWYDDEKEQFHIQVEVKNRYFGTIFGYRGTFTIEYFSFDSFPEYVIPRKETNL